jgi:hypothetical protein
VEFDEKPRSFWDDPDNDGLWDADRSLVEEEAAIHRDLGATNVRIVERVVEGHPYVTHTEEVCKGMGVSRRG